MESFKCVKVLGRGTFGSVHLVYRKDDKKQKRMAMKTIKKEPVEIIHFLAKIKILDGHWKDASGRFVFIWFQLYWKSLIRDREQNQGFDYTREHMKSERQGIAFITHKLWIIPYNLYSINHTVWMILYQRYICKYFIVCLRDILAVSVWNRPGKRGVYLRWNVFKVIFSCHSQEFILYHWLKTKKPCPLDFIMITWNHDTGHAYR